jgi:hypothetical protein
MMFKEALAWMLKVKGINTTSPKISINPNFSAIMSHLQKAINPLLSTSQRMLHNLRIGMPKSSQDVVNLSICT